MHSTPGYIIIRRGPAVSGEYCSVLNHPHHSEDVDHIDNPEKIIRNTKLPGKLKIAAYTFSTLITFLIYIKCSAQSFYVCEPTDEFLCAPPISHF